MALSSSEPPPPSVPAPVQSNPPPHLMYKNRLQEFTSKSGINFPVYQTINEGQDHSPKFRSTVWVADMGYTSQSTFSHKKAAEQEAARLALESILKRTRDEGLSLVNQISPFSKSIMNEYADKLHVEQPTYNTDQQQLGGVLPIFITSLVFNGTSYTGDPARTKKEAEQSAAKAAILSIMGDSSSGTVLVEIIKSKSIFYDAIKGKGRSLSQPSAVLSTTNAGQISITLDHKDTEVAACVADNNNNETKVEFPEFPKMLSTCQELQMIHQESSLEANNVSLQPGSEHSIDNDSTSKKRKKNKKKSNKKLRSQTPLSPITGVPLNQVPPRTGVLMNQVTPCSTFLMNQVPPCTAVPMNQVPPCTAVPMSQLYARTSPMDQVPPRTAPMNQVMPCTAAPMDQGPPRTAAPMNQVPPCSAFPMIQVAPCTSATAAPMNQVPPAAPMNQVPPCTAASMNKVPLL
ncbi:hypothetical protein AAZX31_14G067800 [Glycine max]|nr:hypothetical protein JHK87_038994 [Glycine soja]